MDKIKFRGKRPQGYWAYWNEMGLEYDTDSSISEHRITNLTIVSDTVGQFTGLKDKNGVDIYEGDILQMWLEDSVEPQGGYFHLMYVVFTTEKGFVLWGDNMIIEDAEPLFEMLQWKDCVVIGNIHDNPELLNPK